MGAGGPAGAGPAAVLDVAAGRAAPDGPGVGTGAGGDGGAGPGRVGDHRAAADGPGAAGGPALAGDRRHARAGAGRGAQPAGAAADAWPRAGGPACCSTTGRRQRPRSRPSAERWPARARPPRARSARRSIAWAGPGCVWTSHTPGCCTVNGCAVGGAGVRRAISFAARVMSSTLSAPESSPSGRWCFPGPRLAARWHRPCRIACAPRDRPQPGRPDRRRRTHRNREGHTGDRPDLPAGPGRRGHPPSRAGTNTGKDCPHLVSRGPARPPVPGPPVGQASSQPYRATQPTTGRQPTTSEAICRFRLSSCPGTADTAQPAAATRNSRAETPVRDTFTHSG